MRPGMEWRGWPCRGDALGGRGDLCLLGEGTLSRMCSAADGIEGWGHPRSICAPSGLKHPDRRPQLPSPATHAHNSCKPFSNPEPKACRRSHLRTVGRRPARHAAHPAGAGPAPGSGQRSEHELHPPHQQRLLEHVQLIRLRCLAVPQRVPDIGLLGHQRGGAHRGTAAGQRDSGPARGRRTGRLALPTGPGPGSVFGFGRACEGIGQRVAVVSTGGNFT